MVSTFRIPHVQSLRISMHWCVNSRAWVTYPVTLRIQRCNWTHLRLASHNVDCLRSHKLSKNNLANSGNAIESYFDEDRFFVSHGKSSKHCMCWIWFVFSWSSVESKSDAPNNSWERATTVELWSSANDLHDIHQIIDPTLEPSWVALPFVALFSLVFRFLTTKPRNTECVAFGFLFSPNLLSNRRWILQKSHNCQIVIFGERSTWHPSNCWSHVRTFWKCPHIRRCVSFDIQISCDQTAFLRSRFI